MILVNSGAFLSISSWFCELTELIFVMILYISSTGYPPPPPPPPPQNAKGYGYVQVANTQLQQSTAITPLATRIRAAYISHLKLYCFSLHARRDKEDRACSAHSTANLNAFKEFEVFL